MKYLKPSTRKILLFLMAGVALSLTRNPSTYFRIIKSARKEWKKINEHNLRRTIKSLYRSKLIGCKENNDGTVDLILTEEGKKRILKYDVDKITINKPQKWDGLWRVVIFDIPEKQRLGRMALASKLKELGFYPLQKSVFIHPYECKDEINFITEIFNLVPFVRFMRVRDIDIELDLKNRFRLI